MIIPSRFCMALLILIISAAFLPSDVMATEPDEDLPSIVRVNVPSIERIWEELELLYEGVFHDPSQVDEEIENIVSTVPDLVDIEVLGQSIEGRNITCLRITNEDNPVQKAKTLVVAHHHGREQITVELALRFILYLLNGYGIDDTITEYVDTQEIYIIPTLNPDALEVVVNQGNHWLRKNLRPYDNDGDGLVSEDDAEDVNGDGHISEFYVYIKDYPEQVPNIMNFDYSYREGIDNDHDGLLNEDEVGLVDLNRNYPTFWEDGGPEYEDVTTQVYHGNASFSEPETQAFRDFALKHKFAMTYSLHSGTNATFFPTDEYDDWCQPLLYYNIARDYREILPDGYNRGIGYPQVSTTKLESGLSGSWDEWMYYERDSTVPITFEVYTNESANENYAMGNIILENNTHIIREWKDIYGYFNPEKEYIDTLWTELRPAFDYLLEMTPRVVLNALGISGGVSEGEKVDITMNMECLSPRLSTKDAIFILDEDGNILDSLISIGPDQRISAHPKFELPEDLSPAGYKILIGNNYTGFAQFVLATGGTVPILNPLLIGVGTGVAIGVISLVIIVYFMKSRKNPV